MPVSAEPTKQSSADSTLTLGQLLYADPTIIRVSEKQWIGLIHAMASGDEGALRLLYEKAFPVVFAYLIRLTGDSRLAETVIVEVFEMAWCEAPIFDTAHGPVLGWIMRQARSRALSHVGNVESLRSDAAPAGAAPTDPVPSDKGDHVASSNGPPERLLLGLTEQERQVLEGALLRGLTYAELAAQCGQSPGTIKNWIRSGLQKMQQALQAPGEPP